MSNMESLTGEMQSLNVDSSSNIPSSSDLDGNIASLKQICTHFNTLKCRGQDCGAPLHIPAVKDHLLVWLATAKGSQPAQISGIYCSRCKRYTCVGCRQKPQPGSNNVTETSEKTVVNNCCSKGRLFGNWMLLSRFDEVELQLQDRANMKADENSASKSLYHGQPTGTGFAGFASFNENIDYCQQDDLTDGLMTELLQLLVAFLPRPGAGYTSSFDTNPSGEFFALFRLSLLFDRVTALLRNDSIPDMSERASLYHAVLKFVTMIAKHPRMVSLLTDKRVEKKRSPGIRALGGDYDRRGFTLDTSSNGMAASLVTSSSNTIKQAQRFSILAAKITASPGEDIEDQKSVAQSNYICSKILEFKDTVKATAPDAIHEIERVSSNAWEAFCEKNRVVMTDEVLKNHKLTAKWSFIHDPTKGRMAAALKEIASLSTSLPPGIFLRVSDSRPDVMKVLITGPKGSSCEGGLFNLDMCLPATWPQSPPEIRLSVDGEYDFNQFIHKDGEICLSLLNTTWNSPESEKWQPGRSTLLSVFVSLQYMIFGVPKNEVDTMTCKRYECSTLYYTMLYWLINDNAKKNIFYDVAKMYFKCNGDSILKRVKEAERENSNLRRWKNPKSYGFVDETLNLRKMLEKEITSLSSGGGLGSGSGSRYRY